MKPLDLLAQRFGRLCVVGLANYTPGSGRVWTCVCDCGAITDVRTEYLRSGDTKSCGCLNKDRRKSRPTTHGLSKSGRSVGYVSWMNMKSRCYNKNDKEFHRYGGRGIIVCDRWHSFANFIADIGPRPSSQHSLDRIDPNGNYEPGNCRWATTKQQGRNTRRVIKVEYRGNQTPAIDILEEVLAGATIDGQSASEFFAEKGVLVTLRRMNGAVERW